MLKISKLSPAENTVELQLEGRLIGPWVNELKVACALCLAEGKDLKLNLDEVHFADREGVALLHTVYREGVELANCSPFLAEQLKVITKNENRAATDAQDA
jgi:hypothetical protein